jgi:hypothetical protein
MAENETTANLTGTTEQPSATPTPTAEWRAGPGSKFAGMTKEEILGIAEGQSHALENANVMLQRFNQPVQEPPKNRFDLDIPDDDLVYGRQVKDILNRFANQPPQVDVGARNLAAQTLYGLIQLQRPDEFKRWKSECDAELNKFPVEYWTLDALHTCINIVKSRHIDELAAEKAKQLVSESHPTIRSGTGGSAGVSHTQTIFETAPSAVLAQLRQAGITNEAELAAQCKEVGIAPEQYLAELEKYGRSAVVRG